MSKKILWSLVVVLGLACLAEGYLIYNLKTAAASPLGGPWAGLRRWQEESREAMSSGGPFPMGRFDKLFNDDFFGRRFDPFDEIKRFRHRLDLDFGGASDPLFKSSWQDWYRNRMETADLNPEVKTTDKEVVLSLKVPGVKNESIHINVNRDRIRLSYSVQEARGDKAKGDYFESVRESEKILPVPAEADPDKYRVAQEKDEIRIVFQKKPA